MPSNDKPGVRRGEDSRTRFRSNRIFRIGDSWFIATREGIDVGPYGSAEEAQSECERLVKMLKDTDSAADAAITIREFRDRPRL